MILRNSALPVMKRCSYVEIVASDEINGDSTQQSMESRRCIEEHSTENEDGTRLQHMFSNNSFLKIQILFLVRIENKQ